MLSFKFSSNSFDTHIVYTYVICNLFQVFQHNHLDKCTQQHAKLLCILQFWNRDFLQHMDLCRVAVDKQNSQDNLHDCHNQQPVLVLVLGKLVGTEIPFEDFFLIIFICIFHTTWWAGYIRITTKATGTNTFALVVWCHTICKISTLLVPTCILATSTFTNVGILTTDIFFAFWFNLNWKNIYL